MVDAITGQETAVAFRDGFSVAISGTKAVVGITTRSSVDSFLPNARFIPNVTATPPYPIFVGLGEGIGNGWSVGISDDIAVVGNQDRGLVTFFDVSETNPQQIAQTSGFARLGFGLSVAISGETAIVGSARFAELFDATTGASSAIVSSFSSGTNAYYFGLSVGISGNTAIVGAYDDDENGEFSGAAFLFDATTGELLRKLTPDDAAAGDEFGVSVAISGNIAIVGSPSSDNDNGDASGSVYLFDVSTGEQIAKFSASDGMVGDKFGESVAISGNRFIVGSPFNDERGTDAGAAYIFTDTASTMTPVPLPSSVILLLAALGALTLRRRKNLA